MNDTGNSAQPETPFILDPSIQGSSVIQSVGKSSNKKTKFSSQMISGIIVILVVLAGGGYYLGMKQINPSFSPTPTIIQPPSTTATPIELQAQNPNTKKSSPSVDYVKGEILVAFKKGVTIDDALSLLNTYKLKLKSPDIFYKYIYITIKAKDGKIDDYATLIAELNLKNIKRLEVLGKERTNVVPWILIDFEPAATQSEVDQILQISDNLIYENGMFGPESKYSVLVPEGEEQQIANQLSKDGIVRISYVDTVAHTQIQN